MSITGRVPLLLLLGLVPVVARPSASTVWLWLLVVSRRSSRVDLLLAPRPAALAPRPRARSAPSGWASRRASVLRVAQHRPAPGPGAGARRVAADAPAPPPTGTASTSAPGDRVALRTPLLPRRRGDLHAARRDGPARAARSGSPPGSARSTCPGAVRSLPPFDSRKHLPSRLARLRELDGRAAVRVRGQGTEFDSLREYVRGDDVRSIDWRASARNRNVVVRTWQPERDRRVVLVLDTSRTSAGRVEDVPRLDSAMDAALLLAALAVAGRRPGRLRGRRPADPRPACAPRGPATSPPTCRTRWPTSSR